MRLRRRIWIFGNLSADQNQNARRERQNSHYDRRNGNVEQQSDSGENQIDRQQEHSKIFCDHHGLGFEGMAGLLHAQNFRLLEMTRPRLAVGDNGVAGEIRMTNIERMRKHPPSL
jgi:hypothetical protein